jgi:hypothetical protein
MRTSEGGRQTHEVVFFLVVVVFFLVVVVFFLVVVVFFLVVVVFFEVVVVMVGVVVVVVSVAQWRAVRLAKVGERIDKIFLARPTCAPVNGVGNDSSLLANPKVEAEDEPRGLLLPGTTNLGPRATHWGDCEEAGDA